MNTVDSDSRASDATSQFPSKQDIAQFCLPVDLERPILAFVLQVSEIELAPVVRVGGDIDDTGRATRCQTVQQQMSEQEVRKMIDSENSFYAVTGCGAFEI